MNEHKSLGICIGASSISTVLLQNGYSTPSIIEKYSIPHYGNPKSIINQILTKHLNTSITLTGKNFTKLLNLPKISEAEAIENALDFLNIKTDVVISAGGESFIVYQIEKNQKISKVITGNKCASGTGEFFFQQIKRMNLELDEAIELGIKGLPYNISGRCSVFCKSDCTHALNKGLPKEKVVAGLARMMAQKIIELTSRLDCHNAVLIGGTAKNKAMLKFLYDEIPNLIIPSEAECFEALGAAVASSQSNGNGFNLGTVFNHEASSFTFHDALKNYESKVKFHSFKKETASENDICILGVDVGSTTTKAILLRLCDNAILASEYLRTNGDPIKASVECYVSIKNQVDVPIKINGLGITGSGRQIAGLHALTKGIINEIIAHATATIHFDKEVDTIFEIGGQDAKYTFITAGVASDYAMNEACSAGTGSFLEEAAKESLNIDYKDIGSIAMKSERPPNFNDQCSAFISSDIKNALHEGLSKEDIVAGLVYSVCLNYTNRVKGNRPIGKKIFMQGGVCYNKAVPIAMAALTGKEIIVPPEPGLMGAFGVALEIKKRIELGLIEEEDFSLDRLIERDVEYGKSFECSGSSEQCDRKCGINLIHIEGKIYPFGGACNKYYNLHIEAKEKNKAVDFVKLRQKLVYEKYIQPAVLDDKAKVIGISKSFFTNTIYPLFYNFFTQLGYKIVLGEDPNTSGLEKKQASFCYPAELAHSFVQDLIDKKPDYLFLPHISEIYNSTDAWTKKTCVLLQAENYYIKSSFKEELKNIKVLAPVLNFSKGYETEKKSFVELAVELGKKKGEASKAFDFAVEQLNAMFIEFKQIGVAFLEELENNPKQFAVVLFGRSYNSFAKEANLGIPQKFASHGITILPHDFLPSDKEKTYNHMYWGTGQQLMQAARFVKKHDQLFGTFITNFSCGPDSFIIGYFRNIMGSKPSLTLELDSHSADAGINTRIEAALDIIKSYRELNSNNGFDTIEKIFTPLKVKDSFTLIDSDNSHISIKDKNIKLLIPSMGRISTEAFSAAFRYIGINAEPLPVADMTTLTAGRGVSTCKECLPLIINAGSIIQYIENRKDENEKTLVFVSTGDGPCRLGQYFVFYNDLITKNNIENCAIYTLTDEDSYGGLGNEFTRRGWAAITIGDVFKDIYNAIQALATNRNSANKIFEDELQKIVISIENDPIDLLYKKLASTADKLNKIETKEHLAKAKKISLTGEIFVRHDDFSKMDLMERLYENGFVVRIAPIGEYVYYSNYLASINNKNNSPTIAEKLNFMIRGYEQLRIEKKIKRILSQSGFYEYELTDVKEVIKNADGLINPELEGEAILTVGGALHEIVDKVCGVISIGPFGCMPSRVAESILNSEMTIERKFADKQSGENFTSSELPFLSIETDGNIFPQIIQSKIEIFMLQAERLHNQLAIADKPLRKNYSNAFAQLISKLKN